MQSGGWGVFMAGWLAAGALLRGHCSKSMFYIMTIVLISLLRAFFVITKPNTQPLLSLLFHLSSLSSFSFFSFNSGPNDLSFFPVFWLTGYNLHNVLCPLVCNVYTSSSSFIIINNVIFSRTGFAGRKKKKGSTSTCMYCTQSFVGQAYVCTCMYQV